MLVGDSASKYRYGEIRMKNERQKIDSEHDNRTLNSIEQSNKQVNS